MFVSTASVSVQLLMIRTLLNWLLELHSQILVSFVNENGQKKKKKPIYSTSIETTAFKLRNNDKDSRFYVDFCKYNQKTKIHTTYLAFSLEFSSDSSDDVEFSAVIFPKDSFASPKKSFTLSSTVFSLSGVGS